MASVNNEVLQDTPTNPVERTLSLDLPYSHEFPFDISGTTELDIGLGDFIARYAQSVVSAGAIDLYEIILTVLAPNKDLYIYFGLDSVLSSASAKQLAMDPGNYAYISSDYTKGKKAEETIKPPGFVSTQLRPISSEVTMLRIVLSMSSEMIATLVIRVKVHGVIKERIRIAPTTGA